MHLTTDHAGNPAVSGVWFVLNRTGLYLVTTDYDNRGTEWHDHKRIDPSELPDDVCCHPEGEDGYQGSEEADKETLDLMAEWGCDPTMQYEWFNQVVPFDWLADYVKICQFCGATSGDFCEDTCCARCCPGCNICQFCEAEEAEAEEAEQAP